MAPGFGPLGLSRFSSAYLNDEGFSRGPLGSKEDRELSSLSSRSLFVQGLVIGLKDFFKTENLLSNDVLTLVLS